MEFKSPLTQRIIISFVLLTMIVSGLFGFGVLVTVHFVENTLVTEDLSHELAQVLGDYRQGHPPQLDSDTQFFTSDNQLPEYLKSVPSGFTEVELQQQAYYVFRHEEGNVSYFLVQDQTQFEQREDLLTIVVCGGFLLSVASSFLLGRILVNKVIAPVKRLTHQVRDREKLLTGTPLLSPDYANDEVGTLAKAFDSTLLRLHQALEREALFTSDVSHELRTPLMIINSSCDLLIEKNSLDSYSRQKIDVIGKAAGEIRELVEAFLALARGGDTHMENATLAAVVTAGLPAWRQQAAEKGLVMAFDDATNHGQVTPRDYPAVLLRTVINNLILNAIHHTDQGEISLRLIPGGFELRDSGTGISAEKKPHIFEPFYRGETSHQNSLGLGLSLAQRICEREHWTISLEDNLPRGCLFTVRLG